MKQKLILFSALLIMFLLAGTAGVIGDTENTDAILVSATGPNVTLISPADLAVVNMMNPLIFNFTSQDDTQNLNYQVYIDGEPVAEYGSGIITPGQYKEIPYAGHLSDGPHNCFVYTEDQSGNNCTSEVRKFYVNFDGLQVSLISPDGGFVYANPEFNFSVSGGAGLPFDYELLINGMKVKDGTLVVGEDEVNYYSHHFK